MMHLVRILIVIAAVYLLVRLVKRVLSPDSRLRQAMGNAPAPQPDHLRTVDLKLDPYAVFGLTPAASKSELDAKYHELIAANDPDRAADMSPEIRATAERMTEQIQAAYDELIARRSRPH